MTTFSATRSTSLSWHIAATGETFRKISIHPVAIECCIGKYDENVERLLQKVRDAGIKIWLNSIWASLCDGHDDDRAVELGEPDESWGWILERGGTVIQSDRPYELLQYLKKHKRHKLK